MDRCISESESSFVMIKLANFKPPPCLMLQTYTCNCFLRTTVQNHSQCLCMVLQARAMSREENAILSKPSKDHRLWSFGGPPEVYTRKWWKLRSLPRVWSHTLLLGCCAWWHQVFTHIPSSVFSWYLLARTSVGMRTWWHRELLIYHLGFVFFFFFFRMVT